MKRKLFNGTGTCLPVVNFAVLLAFGLVLAGCATFGGGKSAKTLTITGIPSEYEGKFSTLADPNSVIYSPSTPVVAVVANGEVSLPFSGGGPLSKTVDIALSLWDTEKPVADTVPLAAFGFSKIAFVDGAAEVNYDSAMELGIVTLTDIPAAYEGKPAQIYIGFSQSAAERLAGGGKFEATGTKVVRSGTVIMEMFGRVPPPSGTGVPSNGPFTSNGAKDIMVSIERGKNDVKGTGGAVTVDQTDRFLFKAVQITNGKVSLKLSDGLKEK